MPVIEEIKRNKSSITLVVDGEKIKGVNIEVAMLHGLRKGEIGAEEYDAFIKDNDKANCKTYVMTMIARKARTEKEIRLKLKEKGFLRPSIEEAIRIAKKYGYISDEDYAKNFVETASSRKGGYRIRQELKAKGVSDEYIEQAVGLITSDDEEQTARTLAERYMRGKTLDDKTREKLFRYLCSRGFSYDIVKTVMRELGTEIE